MSSTVASVDTRPMPSARRDPRHFASEPRSTAPSLLVHHRNVVAIRHRDVVIRGGLASRNTVRARSARSLVSATAPDGAAWWIATDAVWSDASTSDAPDRPFAVGLATGSSASMALVAGVSDRLGWEAAQYLRAGGEFAEMRRSFDREIVPLGTRVLDGRLGHDVPTVVVLRDQVVRWGAGATVELAIQRALYGHGRVAPLGGYDNELAELSGTLRRAGLEAAAIDLGSNVLREAGIFRSSAQLFVAPHDAGRSWDAPTVD